MEGYSPVVVRGRRCLRQPEPVCAGVMLADHWPGALSGTAAAAAPRRGVDVGAMDNGGGGVRAWHHSGGDGRAQPVTCAPSLNTLPFAWPGLSFWAETAGFCFFYTRHTGKHSPTRQPLQRKSTCESLNHNSTVPGTTRQRSLPPGAALPVYVAESGSGAPT